MGKRIKSSTLGMSDSPYLPEAALSVKRGEAYTPAHSEKRESFKVDKDIVNFKCWNLYRQITKTELDSMFQGSDSVDFVSLLRSKTSSSPGRGEEAFYIHKSPA